MLNFYKFTEILVIVKYSRQNESDIYTVQIVIHHSYFWRKIGPCYKISDERLASHVILYIFVENFKTFKRRKYYQRKLLKRLNSKCKRSIN